MSVRPTILGHQVPEGYRLLCLYIGSGLIDRTKTLDHGFPYEVLDPIPEFKKGNVKISELCDERARKIISRAKSQNKKIRLFWTGGVDSTATCVAFLKQLQGNLKLLEIAYIPLSKKEYPLFYSDFLQNQIKKIKVDRFPKAISNNRLIITGEHGDQLFGNSKAFSLSIDELQKPWQESFPNVLHESFNSSKKVDTLINYLEPQIRKCPIPLPNLFELFWWINFSLKWQSVNLRLLATKNSKDFQKYAPLQFHFFDTHEFQLWSLNNPDKRIQKTWHSYKWPLKAYIRDYTNDQNYYNLKKIEISQHNYLNVNDRQTAQAIDCNYNYLLQPYDTSLRTNEVSNQTTFQLKSTSGENVLWKNLYGFDG